MRILFCNIAWMKEYRGNEDGKDIPLNGGSFVDETGDAHEKYNFTPVNMEAGKGYIVWDSSRQNHIMVKMSIKCELRILRGVSY